MASRTPDTDPARFIREYMIAMKIIQKQKKHTEAYPPGKVFFWAGVALLAILAGAVAGLFFPGTEYLEDFDKKAGLLRQEVFTEPTYMELGVNPAGAAKFVVFFSVSDGIERARVCHGLGNTVDQAWEDAVEKTKKMMQKSGLFPKWVKADLVYDCNTISAGELGNAIFESAPSSLRYGLALDRGFEAALLEEELNGAGIYDYSADGVNLNAMNSYLRSTGRRTQNALPGEFMVFRCFSWLCDEQEVVWELGARKRDMGRRSIEMPDADYINRLADDAAGYLARQSQENGFFPKTLDARFNKESKEDEGSFCIQAVEVMLAAYRRNPDDGMKKAVDDAISALLEKMVRGPKGQFYLYDNGTEEIRLKNSALFVLVLTEYMDVFQNDQYREECIALGEGIINRMDQDTGAFCHVLDRYFTAKEAECSISCDGAAICALCRLYKLTGSKKWLDAAKLAADRLVIEEYSAYRDPWACRAMDELVEYEPEQAEYYGLALETAQRNLDVIAKGENPEPSDLEMLVLAYVMYCRMEKQGGAAEGFDLQRLLEVIADCVSCQLNGYFYPEYAMYMENPDQILGTFMIRKDNFRINADEVSQAIAGCYLYAREYERMKEDGLEVVYAW